MSKAPEQYEVAVVTLAMATAVLLVAIATRSAAMSEVAAVATKFTIEVKR